MKLSCQYLTVLLGLVSAIVPALASPSPEPEPSLVARDNATNAATYMVKGDGNLVFTLTVNDNGNMWFQMSCSDNYAWMAVGTGDQMDGALMFVGYRDGTENGVTLSGRFSTRHVEPTYSKSIHLGKIAGNDSGGNMTVAGFCSNCTALAKNNIDLNNPNQDFIWAVGPPGHSPWTKNLDGPLREHNHYGYFQMDMTQAKGNGMPQLGTATVHANDYPGMSGPIYDRDFGDGSHSFVMVTTFLIIFPLGIFMLRVFNSAKWHMLFQSAGLVFGLIGLFAGIYISPRYNRSKHFNTAHQIIGICIVLILIGQWIGGFLHHRHYVRNQRPWLNGRVIKVHKQFLGPFVLLAGLCNATLGFRLAVGGGWNLVYVPLVILMLILLFGSVFLKSFLQKRRANRNPNPNPAAFEPSTTPAGPGTYGPGPYGPSAGYNGSSSTGGYTPEPYTRTAGYAGYDSARSDIALSDLGEPPAYSQLATQPKTVL